MACYDEDVVGKVGGMQAHGDDQAALLGGDCIDFKPI